MTDTMHREIRSSGGSKTLLIRRTYAAAIEEVWDAWTRPERLRRWFAEVSGELKEGGTAVVDMTPEIRVLCQILLCDAPHRLRAGWVHPGESDSEIELRLTTDGSRTALELEHRRLDPGRAVGYGPGWEDFLQRLDAVLRDEDPDAISWPGNEAALTPVWTALDGAA